MNFKDILNELASLDVEIDWYGAASEHDIAEVEEALNTKIPIQLRDFFSEYGGGGVIGGPNICGIEPGFPLNENAWTLFGALKLNRSKRKLDEKYLPIRYEEDELLWCIDIVSGIVVAIDFKSSRALKIYDNFDEFLTGYFGEFLAALKDS